MLRLVKFAGFNIAECCSCIFCEKIESLGFFSFVLFVQMSLSQNIITHFLCFVWGIIK